MYIFNDSKERLYNSTIFINTYTYIHKYTHIYIYIYIQNIYIFRTPKRRRMHRDDSKSYNNDGSKMFSWSGDVHQSTIKKKDHPWKIVFLLVCKRAKGTWAKVFEVSSTGYSAHLRFPAHGNQNNPEYSSHSSNSSVRYCDSCNQLLNIVNKVVISQYFRDSRNKNNDMIGWVTK